MNNFTDEQRQGFELIQSFQGSMATVALVLLMARGAAMTSEDIAIWGGVGLDATRNACKRLHVKGLIEKQVHHHGKTIWSPSRRLAVVMPLLLAGGASLENGGAVEAIPAEVIEEGNQAENEHESARQSRDNAVSTVPEQAQSLIKSDSGMSEKRQSLINADSTSSQNWIKADSEGQNRLNRDSALLKALKYLKNLKDLNLKKEKEKRFSFSFSFNSLSEIEKIFLQTDILFGDELQILSPEKFYAQGEIRVVDVFIWLAKAYSDLQKGNVDGDYARKIAFSGIQNHKKPPKRFVFSWDEILPQEFLEACGYFYAECEHCGEGFRTQAALEEHEKTHWVKCELCGGREFSSERELDEHIADYHAEEIEPAPVHPSVTQVIDGGRMTPAKAWETVVGQLEMEMPRASFDTWVRDTTPLKFEGDILTIGVRNAYTRDWLESRLNSTVSRLCVGVFSRSIGVEFEVVR